MTIQTKLTKLIDKTLWKNLVFKDIKIIFDNLTSLEKDQVVQFIKTNQADQLMSLFRNNLNVSFIKEAKKKSDSIIDSSSITITELDLLLEED